MISTKNTSTFVINTHISVKAAAVFSSYSMQYLRRLLRTGKLAGLKIGQIWLIDMHSFENYLAIASNSKDHRFSPNCLHMDSHP